jgi:hypothetical protein
MVLRKKSFKQWWSSIRPMIICEAKYENAVRMETIDIKRLLLKGDLCFAAERHFQQYFNYIVAVSFIGGENRSTRRKPLTCRK